MRKSTAIARFVLFVIVASATAARGAELRVEGSQFTVDGRPTFLLGCSYYGGLGAAEGVARKDKDELKRMGFNWIRVWADWTAFDADLSAVDGGTGEGREPFLGKLVWLCGECDRRGMIVDGTLDAAGRGAARGRKRLLADLPGRIGGAVETLVKIAGGGEELVSGFIQ